MKLMWVYIVSAILFISSGALIIWRDVTAQTKATEIIRQSGEKFDWPIQSVAPIESNMIGVGAILIFISVAFIVLALYRYSKIKGIEL
jgi:hypothetical protein